MLWLLSWLYVFFLGGQNESWQVRRDRWPRRQAEGNTRQQILHCRPFCLPLLAAFCIVLFALRPVQLDSTVHTYIHTCIDGHAVKIGCGSIRPVRLGTFSCCLFRRHKISKEHHNQPAHCFTHFHFIGSLYQYIILLTTIFYSRNKRFWICLGWAIRPPG